MVRPCNIGRDGHIARMASCADIVETKPGGRTPERRTDVLGRSAVTGKLVLKPVPKKGTVSEAQVREAVREVMTKRSADAGWKAAS